MRDEFIKSGVRAEHIDGSTPKPERDAALARLASGEIELVTNCMVLTEGWDMPEVGCCILARPTKKMGLYRQMIGRVLRPAAGQDRRDRARPFAAPCSATASSRIASNGRSIPIAHAESPTHAARDATSHASRLLECTQCGAIRVAGEPCGHCGFLPAPPPRPIRFGDGELGLSRTRSAAPKPRVYDPRRRATRWHAMLDAIANERGYKPGWAAHQVQGKIRRLAALGRIARSQSRRRPKSARGCARA